MANRFEDLPSELLPRDLTKRVIAAAKLFDINVVDHLVIATPRGLPVVTYISIRAFQG